MADGQYLSEKEIDEFLNDLDKNYIEYDEVKHNLDEFHKEIASDPKPHHLRHEGREDEQRHQFLCSVMSTDKNCIPRADFSDIVRRWKIPSMNSGKKVEEDHGAYMESMPWGVLKCAGTRGVVYCFDYFDADCVWYLAAC